MSTQHSEGPERVGVRHTAVRFGIEVATASTRGAERSVRFATVEELLAPKRVELRVVRLASESMAR